MIRARQGRYREAVQRREQRGVLGRGCGIAACGVLVAAHALLREAEMLEEDGIGGVGPHHLLGGLQATASVTEFDLRQREVALGHFRVVAEEHLGVQGPELGL